MLQPDLNAFNYPLKNLGSRIGKMELFLSTNSKLEKGKKQFPCEHDKITSQDYQKCKWFSIAYSVYFNISYNDFIDN